MCASAILIMLLLTVGVFDLKTTLIFLPPSENDEHLWFIRCVSHSNDMLLSSYVIAQKHLIYHHIGIMFYVFLFRNCIGQNFAMNEMKAVIALTLKRYQLIEDPTRKPKIIPRLVLRSLNGIYIKIIPVDPQM